MASWIDLWWCDNGATIQDWSVVHEILDFRPVGTTDEIEERTLLEWTKAGVERGSIDHVSRQMVQPHSAAWLMEYERGLRSGWGGWER